MARNSLFRNRNCSHDRVQIKHEREFISATVVGPEEHGLPQVEIHSRIWENLK